jgi:hypothetical protein
MHVSEDGRTFALSKPELAALARVMSRDTARINLNALWLDSTARSAWTTDGHRALLGTAHGGNFRQRGAALGVSAENVQAIAKAARARDLVALHLADGGAACKVLDGSARAPRDPDTGLPCVERFAAAFPLVTATAPPIDQVVPRYEEAPPAEPSPRVGVNPQYLAALGDLAKIGGDRTIPVVWWHAGELDPFLATYQTDDGSTWRSVIMPMRL